MLDMLDRLSGSIAGFVLFPLKSLLINLLLTCLLLLLTVACTLFSPLIFLAWAGYAIYQRENFFNISIVSLFITGLMVAVSFAALTFQPLLGLGEFFYFAFHGGIYGFNDGLVATLSRALFNFTEFSISLRLLNNQFFSSPQTNTPAVIDEPLYPVYIERPNQDFLDENFSHDASLHSALLRNPEFMQLLLNEVLRQSTESAARNQPSQIALIKNMIIEDPPLFDLNLLSDEQTASAQKIADLKKPVERYSILLEKLVKLDAAIKSRQDSEKALVDEDFLDELTSQDVYKPALLVKQYMDEKNKWRIVPGSTFVTDVTNLTTWLEQNPVHPLTREKIFDPKEYNDKATRYCLLAYTNMQIAEELYELTTQISLALAKTPLEKENNSFIQSGVSPHFFKEAQEGHINPNPEDIKTFNSPPQNYPIFK